MPRGLTKREYAAIQIAAGMCASIGKDNAEPTDLYPIIATHAIKMADEILKQIAP